MARRRKGPAFPGGMNQNNLNALMKKAQQMQEDVQKRQEEIASSEIEFSAGGAVW